MQRLEVSGAVRPLYGSLGFKGLTALRKNMLSADSGQKLCGAENIFGVVSAQYCDHLERPRAGGIDINVVKVKVKFTPEQATKAQRGSRAIAVLFV